jgi:hypothetical protein
MLNVETPSKLLLLQFRIRTFTEYQFISTGFYVEIGQLIRVLKFLNRCDYIVYKGKIMNDEDQIEIYWFQWNDEFICQRRLRGEIQENIMEHPTKTAVILMKKKIMKLQKMKNGLLIFLK